MPAQVIIIEEVHAHEKRNHLKLLLFSFYKVVCEQNYFEKKKRLLVKPTGVLHHLKPTDLHIKQTVPQHCVS